MSIIFTHITAAIIMLTTGIVFAWISEDFPDIGNIGPACGTFVLIFNITCSCAVFYHMYTSLKNPPTYQGVTVSGTELTELTSCNLENMTCTVDGVTYSMESIQEETTTED